MNALASQAVDGTTSAEDYLAGFELSISLPRPGETNAREGVARWRAEEDRLMVMRAEWELTREVHLACEDILETTDLLLQNHELLEIAGKTATHFERAQAAGAATAIQAHLASGDLLAIRAERHRLESVAREERQRLNALLGLPPLADLPLLERSMVASDSPGEVPAAEPLATPEALLDDALSLRPDLEALLAAYEAAEEEVRLACTRQFPEIAIGTGFTIVPGVFTRFHRSAIETALARRAALGGEVITRIHEVRREIHDTHANLGETRRALRFLEAELLPNAEQSLQLAARAFEAGEVTLLEILTLQRALVDARTRTTQARAELRRAHWRLLAASGGLLAPAQPPLEHDDVDGSLSVTVNNTPTDPVR
jgi:outer membrane protein TolC